MEAALIPVLYAALSGVATGTISDFASRGAAALSNFLGTGSSSSSGEDNSAPAPAAAVGAGGGQDGEAVARFLAERPELQQAAREGREEEFRDLVTRSFRELTREQKAEILDRLTRITGLYQDEGDSLLSDTESDDSLRMRQRMMADTPTVLPPGVLYREQLEGSIVNIDEQLDLAHRNVEAEQARYTQIRERLVEAMNEEFVSKLESSESFRNVTGTRFEAEHLLHEFGLVRKLAQCKREIACQEAKVAALASDKAQAEADVRNADKNPAELYRLIQHLQIELHHHRQSYEDEMKQLRQSYDELKRSFEELQLRTSQEVQRLVHELFQQERLEREQRNHEQKDQSLQAVLGVIRSSANVAVEGHLVRHVGPAMSHEFAIGQASFSDSGPTRLAISIKNIPNTGYLLIGVIANPSPSSPSSLDSSSYGWWSNADVIKGGRDVGVEARGGWPDRGWQVGDKCVLEFVPASPSPARSPARLRLLDHRLGSFSLDLPPNTPFRWHVYMCHFGTAVSLTDELL